MCIFTRQSKETNQPVRPAPPHTKQARCHQRRQKDFTFHGESINLVEQSAAYSYSHNGENRPKRVTRHITARLLSGVLCLGGVLQAAERAVSAQALLDSMGLNVHLAFDGTVYATGFPLILRRLQDLHIRHVRDGLIDRGKESDAYYSRHRALAQAGIECDFLTSVDTPASLIRAYRQRVGDMTAVEAPNEFDAKNLPRWYEVLQKYLPVIESAVHGGPGLPGITVYGPSLVDQNWWKPDNSYAEMRLASVPFDYANLHNYPGGRNPGTKGWSSHGYGSIAWALSQAASTWPNTPVVTTETGYNDDPTSKQFTPDSVTSIYTPRIFLEQYLHGIKRTYLYELADDQFSGGLFGLLRRDGSPKPAFTALSGLTELLSETGPAVKPGTLDFQRSTSNPDMHQLLVEKRPGKFLLFLWLELPRYDVDTRHSLKVDPQNVRIHLGSGRIVRKVEWHEDGSTEGMPVHETDDGADVHVSDRLIALEISR